MHGLNGVVAQLKELKLRKEVQWKVMPLTHYSLVLLFYTPWKNQEV